MLLHHQFLNNPTDQKSEKANNSYLIVHQSILGNKAPNGSAEVVSAAVTRALASAIASNFSFASAFALIVETDTAEATYAVDVEILAAAAATVIP